MKLTKLAIAGVIFLSCVTSFTAQADQNSNITLNQLLQQVREGQQSDRKLHQQRLQRFRADKEQQKTQLDAALVEKAAAEQRSQDLEQQFDLNNEQLDGLHKQLDEKLGSMKELFGVLQQTANQSRSKFQSSLTHVQYPERDDFLEEFSTQMGKATRLPSLSNIEYMWFLMQQEMTASAQVLTFETSVNLLNGEVKTLPVTRVGLFNIISDDRYLNYIPETGKLVELPRQPKAKFTETLPDLINASTDTPAMVALDPTRGQLLSMLIQEPDLRERLEQAGVVGYIILGLGALALLITLERLLVLNVISLSIRRQLKRLDQPGNNPLGRILKCFQTNQMVDVETLELRVAETMMKDVPKIQRRIGLLKVIVVISPLLGLLGTVTGMILTFQSLTLFGTGDPRLMAGGISQALVTTVLGLAVAIPAMLLHALVSSKARELTQVLEEQAIGIVAEQASLKQTNTSLTEFRSETEAA